MTLLLRCLRCGNLAEMDPPDPFESGMCMGCFQKYMRTDPCTAEHRRFLRYQRHQERHPTYKALSAALSSLESVPYGTLYEEAQHGPA